MREQPRQHQERRRVLVGVEDEPFHDDALSPARGIAGRLVALEPVDVVDVVHLLASHPVRRHARVVDPPGVAWLDAPGDLRGIDHEHGQARELDERDAHTRGAEAEERRRQRGDLVDGW